ncbi:hypothetical protein KXD40_005754 [Peronospora effusa]|uniref:FAS1 domain-containing protein n=1 Tax=Peronospora effusa TaxID=542832 RepID=A0A3M6VHY8_9STRA|nr:hypothetical protein DD238_004572 [Peronospora effusa]RQM15270.1 hypothetical protein DD237_002985 [Peronospora effusa]UIZ27726.1 hypothetical protein KXD40_005754 [Peronospora effusa]
MTWIMSYLDCLISFASCAKSFNFTRYGVRIKLILQSELTFASSPKITESNTLKATQARHPLQELLVEHYIPNDILLDSSDSLKIVTGQNGSGGQNNMRLALTKHCSGDRASYESFHQNPEVRLAVHDIIHTYKSLPEV